MKCCICGTDVGKYGNNAWPIYWSTKKRCCDRCNFAYVIPARLEARSLQCKGQQEERVANQMQPFSFYGIS